MFKKHKNLAIPILLLLIVCGLCGCGGNSNELVLKAETQADIWAQNIEVGGKITSSPIEAGQPIKTC